MPYIIKTYVQYADYQEWHDMVAHATLESVKQAVPLRWNVPKDGGKITTADGETVEVISLSWRQLFRQSPLLGSFDDFDGPVEDIIAAYNTR